MAEESFLYKLWSKTHKKATPPEPGADGPSAPQQEEGAPPPGEGPAQPPSPPPPPPPPDESLHLLWQVWGEGSSYDLLELVSEEDRERYEKDLQNYMDDLEDFALLVLSRQEAEKDQPFHAYARVRVSVDKMVAWVFAFPPRSGGAPVDDEQLRAKLQEKNVIYGLDDDAIRSLVHDQRYFQVIPVATGIRPIDGEDGQLIECVPRESKAEIKENADGTVDFKSISSFQNVRKGTVLCRITPPTEGTSGVDVRGAKARAKPGKPARLIRSKNTEISPDGTELLASIDGHLTFRDNQYIVEKLLVIEGDVDMSVGNLDFAGDLLIKGDVREGFEVRAAGDIHVEGMVENVLMVAGGSITLVRGMNGAGEGRLEARRDITTKFLENCVAWAGGCICAGSVICSNIASDDTVRVDIERGVIIGGTCTAKKCVVAKGIGSRSHRHTHIVLGNTPGQHKRRKETEEALQAASEELESVLKDIAYLERQVSGMTKERQALLNRLRLKKPVLLLKLNRQTKELEELVAAMEDTAASRIQCDVLYPPTRITIGEATMVVEDIYRNCTIYSHEGEVEIGMQ